MILARKDPEARKWVSRDAMLKRDAKVVALRSKSPPVPYRVIARRLGMSLGGVQKAERRELERRAANQARAGYRAAADVAPADVDDDDDMPLTWFDRLSRAEKAAVDLAGCVAVLAQQPDNALELFRLAHIPVSTPGHPWAVQ
jgi:hypothetical protein